MKVEKAKKDNKPRVVFSGRVKQSVVEVVEKKIKKEKTTKSKLLEQLLYDYISL